MLVKTKSTAIWYFKLIDSSGLISFKLKQNKKKKKC